MRYLHRHPSEVDLTIDQMAEIAWIAREIEKSQAEQTKAVMETLIGTRL